MEFISPNVKFLYARCSLCVTFSSDESSAIAIDSFVTDHLSLPRINIIPVSPEMSRHHRAKTRARPILIMRVEIFSTRRPTLFNRKYRLVSILISRRALRLRLRGSSHSLSHVGMKRKRGRTFALGNPAIYKRTVRAKSRTRRVSIRVHRV